MTAKPSYEELKKRVAALEAQVRRFSEVQGEIKRSRNFLESLLKSIPTPVFWKDTDGRYQGCNPAFTEIMGVNSEQINGKTVYELWPSEHAKFYHQKDLELIQNPQQQTYDFEVKDKDGRRRPVVYQKNVFRDEDGTIIGLVGSFIDISKILQAQEEIIRRQKFLESVLFHAPDAIITLDEHQRVMDWNPGAVEMFGYKPEEAIGVQLDDLVARNKHHTEATTKVSHVLSGHRVEAFETLRYRKDGSHVHVMAAGSPILVEDALKGVVIVYTDISERVRNEKAYRETFEIIAKSPVVAFLWRNEADWPVEFVTANVEHIFGYAEEDFLSGRVLFSQVVHPDDIDRVTGEVVTYSQEPNRIEFTHEPYRIVARGGDIHWINDSTFIRRDAAGTITHYQGIVTDVTDRIRAEEALRHNEAEKRMILNSLKELVIYSDTHMRIVWANKAACESVGLPLEALIGRTCHSIWRNSADPCPGCVVVQAMEAGKAQQAEIHTPDERIWLNKGYPVFNEDGVVSGGIETCLEITERKRAEEALQESEARFRQIASTIREVFWLFDWQEQRVLYVSPAYETIWGRSRDALYESYDEWAQSIHPDDVDHAETTFNRILETGGGDSREYRILQPDGSVRWISDTGYAIKDENDKVSRITGIAEDITARKQAEEALSREKERLAVTLRSIGDAVITTDRDGRIVLMNLIAEQLTGWGEADAVGRQLMDVLRIENEQTGEPCESPVDKVLASGQIVGLANHTILVARDGQRYTVADSGAPIKNLDDQIIGVVLVFRDITAQERTEAELLKMEKLKSIGILAGGIAHDFNNFLTGIIGNLSLAKLNLQPRDPVLRSLNEMEKAAMRAKELTRQLLTFSKGGEPVKRIANIAVLAREAVQFALRGSNVRCRFDLADDLMVAEVDEGQIAQVIHNLTINAIQAMPNGGTVWIRGANLSLAQGNPFALLPRNYVQVAVEDNGTGIHPDHSQKVFDPYFTTKQKGSGLGLAVAYNIVAKHDGRLTVKSELGEGTTFTIFLPASTVSPTRHSEKREEIVSGQGRVLVMDDEDYIRELAAAMLTKLGYEVELAEDGQTAVNLYRKAIHEGRPFDAVILDLTVPGGMGGKEAISHLVDMDQKVRAIVSSGYSNDPVMSNYTAYGFLGVVHKPYLLQEMSQMLKSVIGGIS
jgi:PAS domain S-box-containing protein